MPLFFFILYEKRALQLKGLGGSVVRCWTSFAMVLSSILAFYFTWAEGSIDLLWSQFVRCRRCSRHRCRELFTFSSPEQLGQFHSNLALELRGIKFVQMKDLAFIQGEIITKEWKCIDKILKSSSEPHGQFQPTFAKSVLGWSRLHEVHSNEEPRTFPMVDNNEKATIH